VTFTYKNPHEHALEAAVLEKANLEKERISICERATSIDQRVAVLEAYIQAIRPLLEKDPGGTLPKEGLTNVCRELLKWNARWMDVGDVRAQLHQMGFDLTSYRNPMATLHAVLERVGQKRRTKNGIFYSVPNLAPMSTEDFPEHS